MMPKIGLGYGKPIKLHEAIGKNLTDYKRRGLFGYDVAETNRALGYVFIEDEIDVDFKPESIPNDEL